MNTFSTICAISTPPGIGGVAMIRISGNDAFSIVNKIISIDIYSCEAKKLYNCDLHEYNATNRYLDNCLLAKFVNPNSFTGEDVVELYIHGGIAIQNKVLNELFASGAILAEAGEFTHRAFINGKIDLLEAEAIGNIIHAQTENALNAASSGVHGILSEKIKEIRANLVTIAAELFVDMDFGEENHETSMPNLDESILALQSLLSNADNGIIASSGLNVAIIGAPNVGKSSLLNALLGEERAIVTNIPGTTRDTLSEQANINGHLINFIDTAGIRETNDIIEQIGVERAKAQIEKADLLLVVVDNDDALVGNGVLTPTSLPIEADNKPPPTSLRDKQREPWQSSDLNRKPHILVRNKCDISPPRHCEAPSTCNDKCLVTWQSGDFGTNSQTINISTKTGLGLPELLKAITNHCTEIPPNSPIITNLRQKNQIQLALSQIEEISKAMPLDTIVTSIEAAISALSDSLGENVSEEIVNEIFSKFCVGK